MFEFFQSLCKHLSRNVIIAADLGKLSEDHGVEISFGSFTAVVIALNVTAVVLCLIPYGVVLGFPIGIAATVLIQREMNRFVSRKA